MGLLEMANQNKVSSSLPIGNYFTGLILEIGYPISYLKEINEENQALQQKAKDNPLAKAPLKKPSYKDGGITAKILFVAHGKDAGAIDNITLSKNSENNFVYDDSHISYITIFPPRVALKKKIKSKFMLAGTDGKGEFSNNEPQIFRPYPDPYPITEFENGKPKFTFNKDEEICLANKEKTPLDEETIKVYSTLIAKMTKKETERRKNWDAFIAVFDEYSEEEAKEELMKLLAYTLCIGEADNPVKPKVLNVKMPEAGMFFTGKYAKQGNYGTPVISEYLVEDGPKGKVYTPKLYAALEILDTINVEDEKVTGIEIISRLAQETDVEF